MAASGRLLTRSWRCMTLSLVWCVTCDIGWQQIGYCFADALYQVPQAVRHASVLFLQEAAKSPPKLHPGSRVLNHTGRPGRLHAVRSGGALIRRVRGLTRGVRHHGANFTKTCSE